MKDFKSAFSKVAVLVIGDVMLDRYWWGTVGRISPEAPVPIVDLDRTSLVAGGAANVAANIAGLGSIPILFGVHGDDAEAEMLPAVLAEAGVDGSWLMKVGGRKTAIKTRIVAHSQHVVRIDQESKEDIDREASLKILARMRETLPGVDAIVLSDYAKGFLTDELTAGIIALGVERKIPVIVDPKGRDFGKYRGADVITPNKKEAAEAAQIEDSRDSVQYSGPALMEALRPKALLITEGENGMTLFEPAGQTHLDPVAQDVYDVTGAGDTVIAVFATAIGAGATYAEAARLANHAAGIVVAHVGTTRITWESLLSSPILRSEQERA